jgi:hypothetical protein
VTTQYAGELDPICRRGSAHPNTDRWEELRRRSLRHGFVADSILAMKSAVAAATSGSGSSSSRFRAWSQASVCASLGDPEVPPDGRGCGCQLVKAVPHKFESRLIAVRNGRYVTAQLIATWRRGKRPGISTARELVLCRLRRGHQAVASRPTESLQNPQKNHSGQVRDRSTTASVYSVLSFQSRGSRRLIASSVSSSGPIGDAGSASASYSKPSSGS